MAVHRNLKARHWLTMMSARFQIAQSVLCRFDMNDLEHTKQARSMLCNFEANGLKRMKQVPLTHTLSVVRLQTKVLESESAAVVTAGGRGVLMSRVASVFVTRTLLAGLSRLGSEAFRRASVTSRAKKVTATDSSSRKPGHSDWRTYYRISYQGSGGHTSQQRYYGGNDQQAPQRTTEDAVAEAEARARVAEARAAEAEARARATEAEARHAAPPSQFASSTAAPDFSRMMDPKTWSDPEALKKMGDFWKGLAGR